MELEDIFLGFVVFPEQLRYNIELTQRNAEKAELEDLYERLIYYSECIPDYLMEAYEYLPETITAEINDNLGNKMLLDSLCMFVENIVDWATDTGDTDLVDMSEELLGIVHQTLLTTTLENLN